MKKPRLYGQCEVEHLFQIYIKCWKWRHFTLWQSSTFTMQWAVVCWHISNVLLACLISAFRSWMFSVEFLFSFSWFCTAPQQNIKRLQFHWKRIPVVLFGTWSQIVTQVDGFCCCIESHTFCWNHSDKFIPFLPQYR